MDKKDLLSQTGISRLIVKKPIRTACSILIFLFLCSVHLDAQSKQDTIRKYKFTLSYSALINVLPGAQIGVERRLGNSGFLELEAAYLWPTRKLRIDRSEGYRLKLGYKTPHKDYPGSFTLIFFQRTHWDQITASFDRFNGSFQQIFDFTKRKSLYGLAVGYLWSFEIFKPNDTQVGFSIGPGAYFVSDSDNIPDDAIQTSNVSFFGVYEEEGNYFYPVISFQFKSLF